MKNDHKTVNVRANNPNAQKKRGEHTRKASPKEQASSIARDKLNLYSVRLTDDYIDGVDPCFKKNGILAGKTLFAADEADALNQFNTKTGATLTQDQVKITNMR